jgi:uncharacterized protein YndB with AHSA1/START domain
MTSSSDDTTLRIERLIDAPPEAVFRAWTTKEGLEAWYTDDGGVAEVREFNLRVGGAFRIEWGQKGEAPNVENGTYLQIEPPRLLVMTETLAVPGQSGWIDTKLSLRFDEEDGGKTRLTLVHENFPSQEARDGARGGWPEFIDRLERYVTGR